MDRVGQKRSKRSMLSQSWREESVLKLGRRIYIYNANYNVWFHFKHMHSLSREDSTMGNSKISPFIGISLGIETVSSMQGFVTKIQVNGSMDGKEVFLKMFLHLNWKAYI